jgi:hypothetical protein
MIMVKYIGDKLDTVLKERFKQNPSELNLLLHLAFDPSHPHTRPG